jgi:hypothetical protein
MSLRRFFVPVLLVSPCIALAAPNSARDPLAVAALGKSLAVMSGSASFTDATLTGKARRIAGSDDESGTAILKVTAAGDSRMDLSLPSGPRGEIHTSSADPTNPAGSWSAADGARHSAANHNLYTDSSWFFPALTVSRLVSSQNFILSYAGQESRNGRSVLHVTASRQFSDASSRTATLLQHLSQMDLYLDSATMLPVALAFNTHPDNDAGRDIPVEIRFSDYRLTNGAQVPFHVQKFINNSLVLDLQFETATFNTGLSASDFQAR